MQLFVTREEDLVYHTEQSLLTHNWSLVFPVLTSCPPMIQGMSSVFPRSSANACNVGRGGGGFGDYSSEYVASSQGPLDATLESLGATLAL